MTAAKTLTPEDLLALVRQQAGRFQRDESPRQANSNVTPFQPRNFATAAGTDRVAPTPPAQPSAPQQDAMAVPELAPIPDPQAEFTIAPLPRAIDLEAERSAAFAAGLAQAQTDHAAAMAAEIAAARASAQAAVADDIAEAKATFAAAITRLTQIETDRTDHLLAQMEIAIRNLAAERAGQKIDDLPKPFQRRVEKLVRQIASSADSVIVRMNPADLMAIRPHIKSFSPLAQARLSPDPALGRGDLRLVMDDISFSDCIALRDGGGLA